MQKYHVVQLDCSNEHFCECCGGKAHYNINGHYWCEKSYNACPVRRKSMSDALKTAHKVHSESYERHYDFVRRNNLCWNKGKNSKTDERIANAIQKVKDGYRTGRIVPYFTGRKLSDEHRRRISESMKIAHKEGRAHNIGQSRHNNEHSWPEKFFIRAIEANFDDKSYVCEYPLSRFALDFAWLDKKKCIEIDGDQHIRFKENIERDERKNLAIKDAGWSLLRIRWTDMFNDPQKWIDIANGFIGKPI